MTTPLDPILRTEIFALMKEGRALATQGGDAQNAEMLMKRAWNKIPEPRYNWDISQICAVTMAKFYRDIGSYTQAQGWVNEILRCNPLPGDGEPYVILGSIHYKAGEMDAAFEQFSKARAIAGQRAFQDEPPEYWEMVKKKPKKK